MKIKTVYGIAPAFIIYTDRIKPGRDGGASGPVMRIRPDRADDPGVLAHELAHVRQFYRLFVAGNILAAILTRAAGFFLVGWQLQLVVVALFTILPAAHPLLYRWCQHYRFKSEIEAYKAQLDTIADADARLQKRQRFADFITTCYDLQISRSAAWFFLAD